MGGVGGEGNEDEVEEVEDELLRELSSMMNKKIMLRSIWYVVNYSSTGIFFP